MKASCKLLQKVEPKRREEKRSTDKNGKSKSLPKCTKKKKKKKKKDEEGENRVNLPCTEKKEPPIAFLVDFSFSPFLAPRMNILNRQKNRPAWVSSTPAVATKSMI